MKERFNRMNKKQHVKGVLFQVLIITFFVMLFYIRFSWFEYHIKVAQFTDFTANLFDWKFRKLVWDGGVSAKIYNILCVFISKLYNCISYAVNFSKYWTYAPGQFVFTFGLLPFAYDYSSIKFFGRFPSLVLGCVALILCWKSVKAYTNSNKVALATTSIVGFSWQSILYCMHMSNYEAIIFIGFAASYLVFWIMENNTLKRWIFVVVLLGIMTWFHYQTICYLSGVLLVFLFNGFSEKIPVKKLMIRMVVLCAIFAIIVVPLLFFANMNGVPTWNAGINGEYLYKFSFDLIYTIKFFFINSCKVFKAMLSPVPLNTCWAQIISIIYMLFFLYGTFKGFSFYKKNRLFYLTIFCWGTILTEYFFVFIGKFTLSPTRHSNVLIAAFVLQIMIGIYSCIFDLKKIRLKKYIPYFLSVCITLLWMLYAGEVKKERMDLYTNVSVNKLIEAYSPDLVVDRFAPQLWYLLGNEYVRREIIDYQTDFYDRDYDASNNKKIMIMSCTNKIDEEVLIEVSEKLLERGYITKEAGLKLLLNEPIAQYEYQTYIDFDFYNVTSGSANNFYYKIYLID